MDPVDQGGRRETPAERLDRKFADQLQELRVMQTGAQLTAGFLLTLPFQEAFDDLDAFQRGWYLGLVLLAALTTALVLTPVAVHRRLSGRHVKELIVDATHWLMAGVLGCLALLVSGITVLIFDVVVDRSAALVTGSVVAAVLLVLLVVLPLLLSAPGTHRHPR
ncbi:DUF6328 family protein [Nocardioides sp. zg-DK7169]|uniref:DUF6328 family protein n=1 Tax=Nocardioides sp. zg-DK7169 TaxID=2736600 RepID=UPI00155241AF|nr:DUF6328 family protein [Nocardioides sp. zg-DK7169]NPC97549.1 sodium:proton antiporter [Nocardioides sp. zg-DK7169]